MIISASVLNAALLQRLQGSFRHRLFISQAQCLSTLPRPKRISKQKDENNNNNNFSDANDTTSGPKQPFADFKLEPGEWDIDRKDPYYRPKPPRSRLISAEDFANRPPVGFENEFSSLDDSMIALSWMDNKTCKQIYKTYTDMMIRAEQQNPGRTSHEYVCRVLAQKYQITPWRAAGIIQLQHNEEQMRRNNPELLCEEQAQYAEQMILQNIRDAYRSDGSENPNRNQYFVEDPAGIHGRGAPDEISSSFVLADDIYDMEAKLEEANERDEKLAQILIDDHVYKEDVDESTLEVKTDGAAKRLIKAQQEQQDTISTTEKIIPYPETNAKGEKRKRWKYVAKVVNTRAMKKKGRRFTSYTNNNMENTLVEEDGKLRVATVEEAKQVAWKPSRKKGTQYIYENVQRAWLERTIQNKTDVWGMTPRQSAAEAVVGNMTSKKADAMVESESEAMDQAGEDMEPLSVTAVEENADGSSVNEEGQENTVEGVATADSDVKTEVPEDGEEAVSEENDTKTDEKKE
jgi:hypothetical protein